MGPTHTAQNTSQGSTEFHFEKHLGNIPKSKAFKKKILVKNIHLLLKQLDSILIFSTRQVVIARKKLEMYAKGAVSSLKNL